MQSIVEQRLVRQVLESARSTLVSGLLAGCIVYFAIYRSTGSATIGYWLMILTIITVLRIAALPILRRRLGPEQVRTTGTAYAFSAVFGGIAWALLATFDDSSFPIGSRLMVLITLVSMPAASLSSNAVHKPVFYAFSLPIFAAMVAWAWWLSPDLGVEFGLLAVVYFALIAIVATRYNENLRRSIERDIENERLLHEVGLMNNELQRMAYEDPLTGLSNRRSFEETATELLLRRRGSDVLALMLIDMDNFKWINDTLGHAAGDEALITLSRRIDENSRLTEVVAHAQVGAARIGGDEFIVLYRIDPGSNLDALATRILQVATAPMQFGDLQYQPGISIGIALAPTHANDLDGLLRLADAAMYKAKSRGGRCFVVAGAIPGETHDPSPAGALVGNP